MVSHGHSRKQGYGVKALRHSLFPDASLVYVTISHLDFPSFLLVLASACLFGWFTVKVIDVGYNKDAFINIMMALKPL